MQHFTSFQTTIYISPLNVGGLSVSSNMEDVFSQLYDRIEKSVSQQTTRLEQKVTGIQNKSPMLVQLLSAVNRLETRMNQQETSQKQSSKNLNKEISQLTVAAMEAKGLDSKTMKGLAKEAFQKEVRALTDRVVASIEAAHSKTAKHADQMVRDVSQAVTTKVVEVLSDRDVAQNTTSRKCLSSRSIG